MPRPKRPPPQGAAADKVARARKRLIGGQVLWRLPNGQWKFGGNKFVPDTVAQRLPIEEAWVSNRGWTAYKLKEDDT
ncbi:hypothetical protein [Phenylobacterium sp.]|uniref:hypothetical protein n=1 Tax=Phenylobacterium sp. TaxID=1871053 RepID=UPI00301C4CBF